MKRFAAFALMLVIVISCCACGKKDTSLADVSSKNAIVAGFESAHMPFGYQKENGAYAGFDLDLAQAVASKLGVTLNLHPMSAKTGVSLLKDRSVDFLCSNQEQSSAKARGVQESEPLFTNRVVVAVRTGSGYDTLRSLKGQNVAVVTGTLCEEAFSGKREFSSDVNTVAVSHSDEALSALKDGTVEAVVADEMMVRSAIKDGESILMLEETLLEQPYCLLFHRKDDALCEKVNEVLKELAQDGTLQELSIRWFGADVITMK